MVKNMKKELEYYRVDGSWGWNQDWFNTLWMRKGGCGAVTACDVCIEIARLEGRKEIYPYEADSVTRDDYQAFSDIMKPYLHPRWNGIDRLQIYIEGFSAYLRDIGVTDIRLSGVEGTEPWQRGREAVIRQIDCNRIVPCLVLRHRNPNFNFYEWHWFNLAGYEEYEGEFFVKAVTYGNWRWLNLRELWDNGYERKGGLVIYESMAEGSDRCG